MYVCLCELFSHRFRTRDLQQPSINKQFKKVPFKKNCAWKIVTSTCKKKLVDRNEIGVKKDMMNNGKRMFAN